MIRLSGAFAILAWAAAPPLTAQARYQFTELHLGVAVRLVLYAQDDAAARGAARAAFDRIAELEQVFSDYRAGSEVRQLARRAVEEPGAWQPVSRDLLRVLVAAREVAAATDGAFDPTLGPLVALWRTTRETGRLPDPRVLDSARALTGWHHLELDTAASSIRLTRPGMQLDLGGIAKGYILGEALDVLERMGTPRAMIHAGGDLVLGAAPPGSPGWKVQIGEPTALLSHAAVATSGTGEQFVAIDGVRYAHLIDPGTGLGLTVSRTVTVVGRNPKIADALATAAVVADPTTLERLRGQFPGYRIEPQHHP